MWTRLAVWLLRRLAATWRVERGELPVAGPFVAAIWHGELLPLAALHADRGWATAASLSGDGERVARALEGLGYTVVRGSSSRGALLVLRGGLAQLAAGRVFVLTVDGPRGPAGVPQPGVKELAARAGVPVVWARVEARGWRARSWDRFLVPWPFARVRVRYGRWEGGALAEALGPP